MSVFGTVLSGGQGSNTYVDGNSRLIESGVYGRADALNAIWAAAGSPSTGASVATTDMVGRLGTLGHQ